MTNKLGVVNELTRVSPPVDVFDDTRFSTDNPAKLAACALVLEKLIVPVPLVHAIDPVPGNAETSPLNTSVGLLAALSTV